MKTVFVIPLHTELGELREKIVLLPTVGNNVFSLGDMLPLCDRVVIDLTLDWFRPLMNPQGILSLFADLYGYFSLPGVEKIVFRSYHIETNDPILQKTQRIFEGLLALMTEMFGLRVVRLPTIVSRRALSGNNHPLFQCLTALRTGVSERIPWSATSEMYIVYEMDLLPWLGELCATKGSFCEALGGERYTLGEIVERTEMIFSFSAITFDSHRWFRYLPEGICGECVFSYGIENIAMELLY
ncbi:MAG: hypothetical protein N2314_02470 [Brevinematales bacterium]|nr:hypothetical protein [Brevinematales bacterium]